MIQQQRYNVMRYVTARPIHTHLPQSINTYKYSIHHYQTFCLGALVVTTTHKWSTATCQHAFLCYWWCSDPRRQSQVPRTGTCNCMQIFIRPAYHRLNRHYHQQVRVAPCFRPLNEHVRDKWKFVTSSFGVSSNHLSRAGRDLSPGIDTWNATPSMTSRPCAYDRQTPPLILPFDSAWYSDRRFCSSVGKHVRFSHVLIIYS